MKLLFVKSQSLPADALAQLLYLFQQLSEASRVEIELPDTVENLRAQFGDADAAIFIGEIPSHVINLARDCGAAAIYWTIGLPDGPLPSLVALRDMLDAADVIVTARAAATTILGEITRTPLVSIGLGVPEVISSRSEEGELRVINANLYLNHDDLVRAIDTADVVQIDDNELVVAETMSRGKCVALGVAHDFSELILDGVNGLLISDDGILGSTSLQRDDLARIGNAARVTWQRHFRIDDFARRFNHLVEGTKDGAFRKTVSDKSYSAWIARYDSVGERERLAVRRHLRTLKKLPLISIVLPVFNPRLDLLDAAIASVQHQIHENWELCIADDASTDPAVAEALGQYSDKRIKITRRQQNGHIAACSNSALELAAGEWIALLDQDDVLAEHALAVIAGVIEENPAAGLIYSDEDKIDEEEARTDAYFKSDWNPQLFLVQNFVSHLGVYRLSLLREIGGFRDGFHGSQDYDLALRCSERLRAEQIVHIPRVLYHWRKSAGSLAATSDAKEYAHDSARRAIREHLHRTATAASVGPCPENSAAHRVKYKLPEKRPLISIIIPTRDQPELLRRCIDSLRARTAYSPFEFVIVDNNSVKREAKTLLGELRQAADAIVVEEPGNFNFSRLVNVGARVACGELLAFLNDDIEPQNSDWLGEMVGHLVQPGVGAVGARLWYPDQRLQHGGVILGLGGIAGHAHYRRQRGDHGYFNRAILQQNFSAITGACMLVRKDIFEKVGGFDERNLAVSFNDVDFCLRITQGGLRIAWTPYANLLHHESASRGREFPEEKKRQFRAEADLMRDRWGNALLRDPCYNPNLSIGADDFSLAWPPRIAPLTAALTSRPIDTFHELA